MTTVVRTSIPVNLPVGVHELGPAPLPDGLSSFNFTLDRCTTANPTVWPNASTKIHADFLISIDGGKSWLACGSFNAVGGISMKEKGVEDTVSRGWVSPIPPGTSRQIKATVIIAGGSLVSELKITTS